MSEYRRLLEEAGFTDVGLEVTQRYTVADLRSYSEADALLASPPTEATTALDGKVTSCAITARRPV
jgi:arsenite methyltransferase